MVGLYLRVQIGEERFQWLARVGLDAVFEQFKRAQRASVVILQVNLQLFPILRVAHSYYLVFVAAAPSGRHPERSRGIQWRNLKVHFPEDPSTALRFARDDEDGNTAYCFGR